MPLEFELKWQRGALKANAYYGNHEVGRLSSGLRWVCENCFSTFRSVDHMIRECPGSRAWSYYGGEPASAEITCEECGHTDTITETRIYTTRRIGLRRIRTAPAHRGHAA